MGSRRVPEPREKNGEGKHEDPCHAAANRERSGAMEVPFPEVRPRRPNPCRSRALRGLGIVLVGVRLLSGSAPAAPAPDPATNGVTHEVIALTGQPAPGGFPGETFGLLLNARPQINRRGDVAFVAEVMGIRPNGAPVDVLFLRTARGLFRLAQGDATAPGLASPVLGDLRELALDDAGNVAVLSLGGFGAEAVLSNGSGAWKVIASNQEPHPDGIFFHGLGPGIQLLSPRQPIRLRAGELPDLLFPAGSGGATTVGSGLWSADADGWGPRPLFVQDQPAPGIRETHVLEGLPEARVGPSPGRRSVFLGTVRSLQEDPFPTNSHVVWTALGRGPVTVAARAGERAPHPTPDTFYRSFSQPSVSADGTLAFAADLVHDHQPFGRAAYVGLPGNLQAVVRDGDPVRRADGSEAGPFQFLENLALNARGQLFVQGFVGDRSVLARWTSGAGLVLLFEGEATWPGAPQGWTLGRRGFGVWSANAAGRAALWAELVVAGVDQPLSGLWITDLQDRPVLVAVAGPPGVPQALPLPPGVVAMDAAFAVGTGEEGVAGGSDGLRRFLGDGHEVVYAGTRADGVAGIFVGRIEPPPVGPVDDSFVFTNPPGTVFAPVERSDPAAGTLAHPALLFPDASLQARADKNWAGARLVVEVIENLAPGSDLLGLDARGWERQRIEPSPDLSEVRYLGQPLGGVARPAAGVLEITLRPEATTDGVRSLVRSLAFGASRGLGEALREDARHVESPRRVRLRLTDAGGNSAEILRTIEFPRTIGITFEGHGPEHLLWDTATHQTTRFVLSVQLVLSDGTRLTLGCAPAAAAIEWFPFSQASFQLQSSGGAPCGSAELIATGTGGFVSGVRLHGWEASHTLRRDSAKPSWAGSNGGDGRQFCTFILIAVWLNISKGDDAPARPALAAATTLADQRPDDLLATPYALRDWMRRTGEGRRLASLYEQHAPEVRSLFLADFTLLSETLALIREFLPGLRAFLAGSGSGAVIRPDMVAQLNHLWDRLAAGGSPALREVLQQERDRFRGFQDFSGRTFAEWGTMLGWGAPESPFVVASSPELQPGRFRVEANHVAGLTYLLRHTGSLASPAWAPVAGAAVRVLDHVVELIDPGPAPGAGFYQVQVVAPAGAASVAAPVGGAAVR